MPAELMAGPAAELGAGFSVVAETLGGQRRALRTPRAYRILESRGDAIVVMPVAHTAAHGTTLPPAAGACTIGAELRCRSQAGYWDARVRAVEGHRLLLELPTWTRRPVQRAAVRVPLDLVAISLRHAGSTWAGRLVDVSVGGGGIVVERALRVRPGARLGLDWTGSGVAVVANQRPHDHPLLQVFGVQWDHLDTRTRATVTDLVTRGRGR